MRESPWWRAGGLVAIAVLALAVLGVTVVVFVLTAIGQEVDALARSWTRIADWPEQVGLLFWFHYLAAPVGAFAGLAGATLLVRQERWWALGMSVLVVAGTLLANRELAERVERPWLGYLPHHQTLPSETVGYLAVGAFVLVVGAPLPWRSVAAGGGAIATALTGFAAMVSREHRVSDVAAALLVTLAVAAVGLAILRATPQETALGGSRWHDVPWLLASLAGLFSGAALVGTGIVATGMVRIVGDQGPLVAAMAGLSACLAITCVLFLVADLGSRPLPPRAG